MIISMKGQHETKKKNYCYRREIELFTMKCDIKKPI